MTQQQKTRSETIVVDRDDVVQTVANPYLLRYHEFQSLTKIPSFLAIWAHSFFAGTGVFLVTICARLIDKNFLNGSASVSNWEWITLGFLVVLVLILEGLNFILPSKKKSTEKRIQEHFDAYEN